MDMSDNDNRKSGGRTFASRELGLVSCLIVFGASVAASSDVIPLDQARAWRDHKLTELARRLESVGPDGPMRDEWQPRREWLRRWEPGEMPTGRSDHPNGAAGDRHDLVPEPVLLESLSAAGAADPRRRLKRAAMLQDFLRLLDTTTSRKTNLAATIDVAETVDTALTGLIRDAESANASPGTGTGTGVDDGIAVESLRWALAHTRYRRARAVAYRELPDVLETMPIEAPRRYERALRQARRRLLKTFAEPRPEFVLLEVRMLRRDGKRGQALARLERFVWAIDRKWYLKKRRDLLDELGWKLPHREAAAIYQAAGYADHTAAEAD